MLQNGLASARRSEVETPWATLPLGSLLKSGGTRRITPSKGLLLYQDQAPEMHLASAFSEERNGGMSWQEGLRKFFEGEPALGREAERLLSEAGVQRPLKCKRNGAFSTLDRVSSTCLNTSPKLGADFRNIPASITIYYHVIMFQAPNS